MTTPEDFKDIPHKERCAEFAWLISKAILSLHGQTAPRNPFSPKRENEGSRPTFPQTCRKASWPEGFEAARREERTGLPAEAKRSSEPDKKPIEIKEQEQQ